MLISSQCFLYLKASLCPLNTLNWFSFGNKICHIIIIQVLHLETTEEKFWYGGDKDLEVWDWRTALVYFVLDVIYLIKQSAKLWTILNTKHLKPCPPRPHGGSYFLRDIKVNSHLFTSMSKTTTNNRL